jgi:hypothetical protein
MALVKIGVLAIVVAAIATAGVLAVMQGLRAFQIGFR